MGTTHIRVMTYNLGLGRKDFGSSLASIVQIICDQQPDLLALQEAVDYQDVDAVWRGGIHDLARSCEFGDNFCFGPALTLADNFDTRRSVMIDALYSGHRNWRQGNALYSRLGFCDLDDPHKTGIPYNIPIFRPPVYEGNRDTEPRHAVLGRVSINPIYPYVLNTHLTTLIGERGSRAIPGKAEEARVLRYRQVERLLDLVRSNVLQLKRPVILLGDFNATADEVCISSLLVRDAGFVRLVPEGDSDKTHAKAETAIDHILIYPGEQLADYRCWLIRGDTAMQASDHLPVIADVMFWN